MKSYVYPIRKTSYNPSNIAFKKLSLSQVPTPLALLGLMVNVERVSAILSLRA
jgi:hypothetical protein